MNYVQSMLSFPSTEDILPIFSSWFQQWLSLSPSPPVSSPHLQPAASQGQRQHTPTCAYVKHDFGDLLALISHLLLTGEGGSRQSAQNTLLFTIVSTVYL